MMSNRLKTTIALSSALVALIAATGGRAQTADENENASAPTAEWVLNSEGMRPVFRVPREPGSYYTETVEQQNHGLSAVGSVNAPSKNRKVRSED